jgi:hypothetical protein
VPTPLQRDATVRSATTAATADHEGGAADGEGNEGGAGDGKRNRKGDETSGAQSVRASSVR